MATKEELERQLEQAKLDEKRSKIKDVKDGIDLDDLNSGDLAHLALKQMLTRGFDHNPIVDPDILEAYIEALLDESSD